MALRPLRPSPSAGPVSTTWVLALCCILAGHHAAAQTAQIALSGFAAGYTLTVEDLWQSPVAFDVAFSSDLTFDPTTVTNVTAFIKDCVHGSSTVTNGIETFKTTLFAVSNLATTGFTLTSQTTAATGLSFVSPINDTLSITIPSKYCTSNSATALNTLNISGIKTAGTPAFTIDSTNELQVRQNGFNLVLTIQFNAAKTLVGLVTFASSDARLTANLTKFVATSLCTGGTLPCNRISYTLVAQPTFNISSDATLTATVNTAALYVAKALSPSSATFPIKTIDNKPLAFCVIADATITEAQLRDNTTSIVKYIQLNPPTADSFLTTSSSSAILASLTIPSSITAQVLGVNTTTITLRFSATTQPFDTNAVVAIGVVIQKRLLASAESGCGSTFLSVVPSPAIVTGENLPFTMTELDVNDKGGTMIFTVLYDVFVDPPVLPTGTNNLTQQSTNTGADYTGFDVQILPSLSILRLSSTRVIVSFPKLDRYNIPQGSTELINISFPGSAFQSGVAPVMVSNSFNITAVDPTFNVTFTSLSDNVVSTEQLWNYGANMTLYIRGDVWDANGQSLWTVKHPQLAGSIPADSLSNDDYAFGPTEDRLGGPSAVIRYGSVNLTYRVAILQLNSMPGLSLPFDERVRMSQVSQLIPGRPTITQQTFTVVQVQATSIVVSFLGVAAPSTLISEKAFRNGFWFAVQLSYQVFTNSSYSRVTDLFSPVQSDFAPFMTLCNASRPQLWIYNVTCLPMPTFDIDNDIKITVAVPSDAGNFYYAVAPQTVGRSSIVVIAASSPTCNWGSTSVQFTEGDIRTADAVLYLLIDSSDTFNTSLSPATDTSSIVTSTAGSKMPLKIVVESILKPHTLRLRILVNTSFDINEPDQVSIRLTRFFMSSGERCNALNFTITVLPGHGYTIGLPSSFLASDVRNYDVKFQIALLGERVIDTTTAMQLKTSITYLPNKAATRAVATNLPVVGFAELIGATTSGLQIFATVNQNISNASVVMLDCTLKKQPNYRILQGENLTLAIPSSAVASQETPIIDMMSLVVYPSPSRLNATYSVSINEVNVTQGTAPPIVLRLLDDWWNVTQAVASVRASMQRTQATGLSVPQPEAGSLFTILSTDAFSFPSPDTMVIKFQPDELYDAVGDEMFFIAFGSDATASGVPPIIQNISIFVIAGTPYFIGTGTAMNCGSRAFILGGLELDLYLANDVFIADVLTPHDVCPFADCTVSLSDTLRVLSVVFQPLLTTVITSDVSYQVYIKPSAIKSGSLVPNITMNVRQEPGIATLRWNGLPSVVYESTVGSGQLPELVLSIIGDRFVSDSTRLGQALSAGTSCTPTSDAFGFCSRSAGLFGSQHVQYSTSRQAAIIQLQADSDYDIFQNELVNITISGLGVDSGLAPSGWVSMVVQPVRGTFFISTTSSSLSSYQLATDDNIQFVLTLSLNNERFTSSPASSLIDASRSSATQTDEPSGYERYKTSMYQSAVLAANQRVLVMSFKRVPGYTIANDETVTFTVPAGAVLSSFAPTLSVGTATLTIVANGGVLTLVSPSVTTADTIASSGYNFTLATSDAWDELYVTRSDATAKANLYSLVNTDDAPSDAPNGFSVYKSVMMPVSAEIVGANLVIRIASNAKFALTADETITFKVDNNWGKRKQSLYPASFTLLIKAQLSSSLTKGDVVLYMLTPVDQGALQRNLAQFLGISATRVVVISSTNYDDAGVYQQVRVAFLDPTTTNERTSLDAIGFLLQSQSSVLAAQLNVTALESSAAPLDTTTLRIRLGLQAAVVNQSVAQSLIWVWVCLGLLVAGAIGGFVYYRFKIKGTMTATAHFTAKSGPLLRLKTNPDDEKLLDAEASWIKQTRSPSPQMSGRSASPDAWSPDRGLGGVKSSRALPTNASKGKKIDGATAVDMLLEAGGKAPWSSGYVADDNSPSTGSKVRGKEKVPQGPVKIMSTKRAVDATGIGDDPDEAIGPTLAGQHARTVRIDLDEFVDSKQPAGFLRRPQPKLELPPLPPAPEYHPTVAVYPLQSPDATKFRNRRIDSRFI